MNDAIETLTCPHCAHTLATSKVKAKPDETVVGCPECSNKSPLSGWRASPRAAEFVPDTPADNEPPPAPEFSPEVPFDSSPPPAPADPPAIQQVKKTPSPKNRDTISQISYFVVQVGLMGIALVAGVVFLIAAVSLAGNIVAVLTAGSGTFDRFRDDNAFGKVANEIQYVRADLAFIRSFIVASCMFVVIRRVSTTSTKIRQGTFEDA
ncbi:hypothetical protein FYK55_05345 [Roseiconus nitratireducens]|uniref:Uncharacterized protein n=1 Tax=Roseiconus nitratireducens TaxID=2605748 RepID=A0A5M6DFZ0_9BACT|nr:hypothetical protein [Roseiconus nitratireducens]KAA5545109.1 hypothetical protein FYK55_05345 [Roseiconus nitratireducens]